MRERLSAFFLGLLASAIIGSVSWLHELDTRVTVIETTQLNFHDRNSEKQDEIYQATKEYLSGLRDCQAKMTYLQETINSLRDRPHYGR